MMDNFLTVKELSKKIGFKIGSIYNMVQRNEIPHYRYSTKKILFKESEISAWLEKMKVKVSN
ncbi:MAG: helix-turn-helix domain-containing protein [Candidatus Omnitrophica bacterium]|nr:helix-turn-helix domain-containing protein [Candidatus Omnitrophota bacterium]